MLYDKILVPHYVWAIVFAGLLALSWTWLRPKNNMLFASGNVVGVLGLMAVVKSTYRRGMEDKSVEIADANVKNFLRRARAKSPSLKGKNIPTLHKLIKPVEGRPFLRLVTKGNQAEFLARENQTQSN